MHRTSSKQTVQTSLQRTKGLQIHPSAIMHEKRRLSNDGKSNTHTKEQRNAQKLAVDTSAIQNDDLWRSGSTFSKFWKCAPRF